MPAVAKPREGLPFFLFVIAVVLGSIWNGAGGDLDAFSHIWDIVAQKPPSTMEEMGRRAERLVRLPQPVRFPAQKVVRPSELDEAAEVMKRLPGPRPPLELLGAAGRPNPFFPKWVQDMVRATEVTVEGVPPEGGPDEKGGKGASPTVKGGKDKPPEVQVDAYVFTGVVKIQDDPPAAVLRDVARNLSVFLREGEKYRQILAVKVDLGGATFLIDGREKHVFDTLHSTNKTFTVRRL